MTRKRAIKLLMSIDLCGSRVDAQRIMKMDRYRGETNAETVKNIAAVAGVVAFNNNYYRNFERCVEVFEKASGAK